MDSAQDRDDAAEAARTLPDDFVDQLYDADPEETREWIDSLDAVAEHPGPGARSLSPGQAPRAGPPEEPRRTADHHHPVCQFDPARR